MKQNAITVLRADLNMYLNMVLGKFQFAAASTQEVSFALRLLWCQLNRKAESLN